MPGRRWRLRSLERLEGKENSAISRGSLPGSTYILVSIEALRMYAIYLLSQLPHCCKAGSSNLCAGRDTTHVCIGGKAPLPCRMKHPNAGRERPSRPVCGYPAGFAGRQRGQQVLDLLRGRDRGSLGKPVCQILPDTIEKSSVGGGRLRFHERRGSIVDTAPLWLCNTSAWDKAASLRY